MKESKQPRRGFLPLLALLVLFALAPMQGSAQTAAQKPVSLNVKAVAAEQVFKEIRKQSGLDFFYSSELSQSWPKVTLTVSRRPAIEVVVEVAGILGCSYDVKGNIVTLTKQKLSGHERTIKGHVVDDMGQPLSGVPVCIGESRVCTVTDDEGFYTFSIPVEQTTLKFSYVGMTPQYITVQQGTVDVTMNVAMRDSQQIDEVIVTGVVDRKASSYTGSVTSIKGDELRRMGNQNVFQSLKNLDASVIFSDKFDMGSNPNSLPNMTMRGGTSFPSETSTSMKGNYENQPNQPLFILDGFEATAERIFDLDMNTVESLTILKDASAKALYGSKAANGVIVIETKKLNANKPRFTYTGSVDLQMPDLSSYKLCNSLEKLQVELKEGYFDANDPNQMAIYYDLYERAKEGFDTYWLSKPVRFGYGQKHSIGVELGTGDLRTTINLAYNHVAGIMKGSNRQNIMGDVNVAYTFKKRLRFQNNLSIVKNNSKDSPYGSFSNYAKLNPYESLYDENGEMRINIGDYPNYYRNGLIGTELTNGYFNFTNNFLVEWTIMQDLRLRGRFQVNVKNNEGHDFYPAEHTNFNGYTSNTTKGSYTLDTGHANTLSGDLNLNYSKEFGKNVIFANLGGNLSTTDYAEYQVTATGFSSEKMKSLSFANQYLSGSHPTGSSSTRRELGATLLTSYSYDNRYLTDFTYRLNASSVFGNEKRWAPFWSVGIGWNVHNEPFLKNLEWLKQFKLRASIGNTGNQSFQTNKSLAVYSYMTSRQYNGLMGATAQNMANPWLQWESKMDYNLGFDASIHRLNARFDIYKAVTTNMVTSIGTVPSTGFTTVSENLGKVENTGIELYLNYGVVRTRDMFLNLTFSMAKNTNKIVEISDAMREYNESILASYNSTDYDYDAGLYKYPTSAPIIYEDGADMNAIWAVQSLGIDPATGMELYLGKDGQKTYVWKSSDLQAIGSTSPKVRGNFGFNGEYKGWGLSVNFTYQCGGKYYNNTLLNKIENIYLTDNFDRRALTERWQHVDQEAFFKSISQSLPYNTLNGKYADATYTSFPPQSTRATSRFIQDRNDLYLSSISAYYEVNSGWVKKMGAERMKITAYMNDIAQWSSIGIERGTDYPFSRTLSLQLSLTF